MKLGIRLESLGLPFRRGLEEIERLGVAGAQMDAAGDFSPKALSQTGRREVRQRLRAHDLTLTALGCPLRRGLDAAEQQEGRIDHVKNVMSLAYDLGCRIVIVQAGKVPTDGEPSLMRPALQDLARHGDRTGVFLALETGLEAGAELGKFLSGFDTGSLGVNFDPANLLLNGFDPIESLRSLRDRVLHVHAHDARKASASRAGQEVPLGHGDIDWMRFVEVLRESEYSGYLIVERESGDNRLGDVTAGVGFLRRFVG